MRLKPIYRSQRSKTSLWFSFPRDVSPSRPWTSLQGIFPHYLWQTSSVYWTSQGLTLSPPCLVFVGPSAKVRYSIPLSSRCRQNFHVVMLLSPPQAKVLCQQPPYRVDKCSGISTAKLTTFLKGFMLWKTFMLWCSCRPLKPKYCVSNHHIVLISARGFLLPSGPLF